MRRACLAPVLLALLAACGREAPAPPPELVSYRDRTVPIASTVRGGPADLGGEWVVSAAYPGAVSPGGRIVVEPGPDGAAWRFLGPLGEVRRDLVTTLPGRYAPRDGAGLPLWVLWVDDDFRTAVVGTPDGSLGWIMDRPGAASGDRTTAAREVLDWAGYDLAALGPGA